MNQIQLNVKQIQGPLNRFFNFSISSARAYLLLRADHQKQLAAAVKECGFRYLRFHGLFQDDMGVYRENDRGEAIYSWVYVDAVYDFLMDIGLRPFVVFDFMPSALANGSKTVYWEKANVTRPKDYAKWGELVQKTVEHFTRRYGEDEVAQWFFEVWNEPDNDAFFDGTLEDYLKLYSEAAQAVARVSKRYKVGGPATAFRQDWIGHLIRHCREHQVPLHFVTTHTYSSKGFRNDVNAVQRPAIPVWDPGPSWNLGDQCFNKNGAIEAVSNARKNLDECNSDLPLYFTEWGLTWDYWDPLRDSYHAASFLLSRLKAVWGQTEAMSLCELSDIFEEDGPLTTDFNGGFGLVNVQGIRKSSYFAYYFLNRLGELELECDYPHAIAGTDGKGSVQLLFWDESQRQDEENKLYYNRIQPALETDPVTIKLSGLTPGQYRLQLRTVGYRQNDPYTRYLEMKPEDSLSREEIAMLDRESQGDPVRDEILEIGTEWEITLPMLENDVHLLELEPIK